MIKELAKLIPPDLMKESGAVFYSGRSAFSIPSSLYILGLNPGGSPQKQDSDTVESHTERVLNGPDLWSAYKNETWRDGQEPGSSGMQPRVLHLLKHMEVDPQKTPASNVVFVRSARERDINERFLQLAELCWPFHEAVIERLGIRVVLCFGQKAGNWVCKQTKASIPVDEFKEKNSRGWVSRAFKNPSGMTVAVATHPSIADWTCAATDPSDMVRKVLLRAIAAAQS